MAHIFTAHVKNDLIFDTLHFVDQKGPILAVEFIRAPIDHLLYAQHALNSLILQLNCGDYPSPPLLNMTKLGNQLIAFSGCQKEGSFLFFQGCVPDLDLVDGFGQRRFHLRRRLTTLQSSHSQVNLLCSFQEDHNLLDLRVLTGSYSIPLRFIRLLLIGSRSRIDRRRLSSHRTLQESHIVD